MTETETKMEQIIKDVIHKLRYRGEHMFADEIERRLNETCDLSSNLDPNAESVR